MIILRKVLKIRIMKKLLLPLLLMFSLTLAKAQCENFKVDFKEVDSAGRIFICTPSVVGLEHKCTLNSGDEITSYHWSFGDGAISKLSNPFKTYLYPGKFNVKLVVATKNGCIDSIQKDTFFEVFGPKAAFSINEDTLCLNQQLLITNETDYKNSTSGFAKLTFQIVGGEVFSPHPLDVSITKRLENPGTFELKLTISQFITDPKTGINKECTDVFPFEDRSEKKVIFTVKDVEIPRFVQENNKLYISNQSQFDSILWEVNSNRTKSDTLDITGISTRQIQAFVYQNGCGRYYADVLMGVEKVEMNFANSYKLDFSTNTFTLKNNSQSPIFIEVYSGDGKLILKNTVNENAILSKALLTNTKGVIFFRVSNSTGDFNVERFSLQ